MDADGVITDVSPLTAEILLSEGVTSSDWEDYPISSDDYEWFAEDMLKDSIYFAEEDDQSQEPS